MDFNRLCKDILGLESKIRFAGVCDDSGAIKYGGQREGITNLLSPEETKRSNLQALARWALRNSLASKVGKGKYAMSEYRENQKDNISARRKPSSPGYYRGRRRSQQDNK